MEKLTRLIRNTKKGSYIVEAALVVPVFIIGVIMIISIIPVISAMENMVFIACDEIRRESVSSAFISNPLIFNERVKNRVRDETLDKVSYDTAYVRYGYRSNNIDDLITYKGEGLFSGTSPVGFFGQIDFSFTVTGRKFSGTDNYNEPTDEEEFKKNKKAQPVCIFPEAGEKYHSKDCTYVKANYQMAYLNKYIKKKYRPCKKCSAKKAEMGTPVFYFSESGDVYHTEECKSIRRYFIVIDKEDAVKKGYTPCSKCGGG